MATDKFEYILRYGNHKYNPEDMNMFVATDAVPGSQEKVAILERRAAAGHPLWHPNDRVDFHGYGAGCEELADRLVKRRNRLERESE